MKLKITLWLITMVVLSAFVAKLSAQAATGTISGTISDSSGAVVPNASVTLTNTNTNASRNVTSDGEGRFIAPLVPVGRYTISATAPGFRKVEQSNVLLEQQANLVLNFNLSPASQTSTVEVAATAVEIQTGDVSLGQTVHSEQVAQLPLNGRNFVQLATLTPGTASTNGRSGSETQIRGNNTISVGGSRQNHVDYLFDGIDNNELTAGGIGVLPSIDAIDEFKVLVSNYSAQYGSRAGPTVLVTSKSGTNKFHGTLFEFLRNTVLNSHNYFSTTNPRYNQNQFGGVIGGPIKKDKFFFFFDYQGNRVVQAQTFFNQVPTALQRQGIFTETFTNAAATPIYDPSSPSSARTQFMNNTIPGFRISTIAQALLNLYPLPNVPNALANNYVSNANRLLQDNEFDFRLDYTISAKDAVFARFSRDQATSYIPTGLPGLAGQSNQTLADRGRNVAISETHIFSSTRLNQFTAGYNRAFDHIVAYGDGTNWSDHFGIPNANLGTYLSSGLMDVKFSNGFANMGGRVFSPIQDGTNVFQYDDMFDWVLGGHSLSVGIDTRFMQLNEFGLNYSMGTMTFSNLFTAGLNNGVFTPGTGNPIASFLLGLPVSGSHDWAFSGQTSGRRWKMFRPYIQDNWRVNRKLVLELGLGYNYTSPIVEALGRQTNFDFANGKLLIPGVNSGQSAGITSYKTAFEPRVGFSYSPFSNKSVVRAGYMILHDSGWNLGAQGLDLNPPYAGTYAFQDDNITPATTLSQGFPVPVQPVVTGGTTANLSGNIYSMDTSFRPGLVQQANLSVEGQLPLGFLLTAGYVGMRSSHLQTAGWNLNTAPANLGTDPPNLRPYPQFVNIIGFLDRGLARYDSLQVKAERALGNGLYVLASYTYSRGFDNGTADNVGGALGVPFFPLVPRPRADKGLSITSLTNNFSSTATYNLPFGRGAKFGGNASGLANALIGGWQTNVIFRMSSGFPLGVNTGVNTSGTVLVTAGNNVNNRPNQTCNPRLSQRKVTKFFNTACFVDPTQGVLGNAYRTPMIGPNFTNADGSLFKSFDFNEGRQLLFRTEVFNVANHPQFANPGTTTDSGSFGVITATVNNPRLIQFGLKLLF